MNLENDWVSENDWWYIERVHSEIKCIWCYFVVFSSMKWIYRRTYYIYNMKKKNDFTMPDILRNKVRSDVQ